MWGRRRGWNTMFHALDLAVKILHFALLSTLQNKPFRSAISNVVFRRLFRKMFKCLSLPYSRKVAKTELYQRELFKKRRDERKERSRKNYEKGKARVWVFVELYEKQLNSAAGSLNVCDAPLCGCMSKHFTLIRKICSLIHLQYLCEELCFAIAFCEYEAYQGAASRCRISRFCQGKNISLLRGKYGLPIANIYPRKNFTSVAARTVSLIDIAALRRTSGCSVTLPGQASIRVRERALHLRAGLNGEDAGNTWLIIKLSLVHFLLTYITHTYAGHMSIRVHRRTRDLRTDLDKGAAGNTCRIIKIYLVHILLTLMPDRRY